MFTALGAIPFWQPRLVPIPISSRFGRARASMDSIRDSLASQPLHQGSGVVVQTLEVNLEAWGAQTAPCCRLLSSGKARSTIVTRRISLAGVGIGINGKSLRFRRADARPGSTPDGDVQPPQTQRRH
jgi:hypothetical protein